MSALQHLDDGPFLATASINGRDRSQHPVIVHHLTHLARCQIQVIVPFIGDDKTKPVGVSADTATDQVCMLRQAVGRTPILEQLAGGNHGHQHRPKQLIGARLVEIKQIRKLPPSHRPTGLLDGTANLFARNFR